VLFKSLWHRFIFLPLQVSFSDISDLLNCVLSGSLLLNLLLALVRCIDNLLSYCAVFGHGKSWRKNLTLPEKARNALMGLELLYVLWHLARLSPIVRPRSHNSLDLGKLLPCFIYVGHSDVCPLLHLLFLLQQMLLDWCQRKLVGCHVVSQFILGQPIVIRHIERIDQWSLGATLIFSWEIIHLPAIRIRFSSLSLFRASTPS